MTEILTKCGYRCDLCPAYVENLKTETDRQTIVEGWQKYYNYQTSPESIGCVGCLNEGKHLEENCPVRTCSFQKNLANCAHCETFSTCNDLKGRMDFTESLLVKFREMPAEDYDKFIKPYQSKDRLQQICSEIKRGK